MRHLSIDIETYSSVDIKKSGAYKYAESEDFEILLFAYKVDRNPVRVIDLASGEKIPSDIVMALKEQEVVKHAYNAVFEWNCLNMAGYETPIEQWRCTMIHGLYCGFPAGLEAIGKAIGIPEDKQKLTTGKALIKYFCTPCNATKSNGGRTRNLPHHDPDRWNLFKEYNAQDVEAEHNILERLISFPVPNSEWQAWIEDTELNYRGIAIDKELLDGALYLEALSTNDLMGEAMNITGLKNPKSNAQMLEWLNEKGIDVPNMQKATIAELLTTNLANDIRRALELKQKLGKTSVSKYMAMDTAMCKDGRIRGLLQFYGANRTGRFAGRLVQVQNLPRNYLKTLDGARNLVKTKDYTGVKAIYGNVPDTLSQLIRTAFVPRTGKKFIVSDFSAIEARVIAWLAEESWVLDTFKRGEDIYCATASQMFGVPVEKNGINGELRQKGKVATLALGYQGGAGALVTMGALNMGIAEDELQEIVTKWRLANPNIVNLWYNIERLATHTIETGEPTYTNGITLRCEADLIHGLRFFTIELPSGRKLFYASPDFGTNRFGKQAITYMGINQTTRKWETQETYGGKLTENIVQAIARDCLVETLKRCTSKGYKPVMHIHDEIVIEAEQTDHLDDVNDIFAEPITWAPGLPLSGAGFESEYYMKD